MNINQKKESKIENKESWFYYNIHDLVRMRVSSDQVGLYSLRKSLSPFEVEYTEDAELTLTNGGPIDGEFSFGTDLYKFLPNSTFINSYGVTVQREGNHIILIGNRDLTPYVMPLMQWILLTKGASFVHGASISIGGKGVLMPAWGGTGKTSAIMELLKIADSGFMGDDIAIVNDQQKMFNYPKPFFIYPYHKELFPHLFKNKPKLVVPSFMSNSVGAIRQMVRPVVCNFPKVEQFCRKFTPEHMQIDAVKALPNADFADTADISLILFLERYNGEKNVVDELTVETARRKVVGNLYFELGEYAQNLMTACGSTGLIGLEEWFSRMGEVIQGVFEKYPLYRIRMVPMKPEETGETIAETVRNLLEKV
ncbi:MAG: hypothetical protein ACQ9MH_16535 [Nitrospinales bacterium]